MRLILIFLTILFCMAKPADAIEAILGRITSVQPDNGVIVVDVSTTENKKKINVALPEETDFSMLKPNMLIRIWGDYKKADTVTLFFASQISPADGSGSDPTGVRKRLRKGHGAGAGSGTNRQGWRHGTNNNRRH